MDHHWLYPHDEHPPDLTEPLLGSEADAELIRMGTSADRLRQVALRSYLAGRDFAHPHFPPTTAGFNRWSTGNKLLRDLHVPSGWTARNDSGVPKVVSPDGSFSMMMVAGNEDTGLSHRIPSTATPRGPQGAKDVRDNRQGDLFGYSPPTPTGKTWMFLVAIIELSGRCILRAELSLPWQLDRKGDVVAWYRRIILPEVKTDDAPPEPRTDDAPPSAEIDVPVERRGA